MNNKGEGRGLALILILIVALIVAFLAVKQMDGLGVGNSTQTESVQDPVQQARDAVDALNERINQTNGSEHQIPD